MNRFLAAAVVALAVLSGASAEEPRRPDTPKKPVVDVYHGEKVTDDYRWLESAADPAVKQWYDAQSNLARSHLDKIGARKAIHDRLRDLISAPYFQYGGLKAAGGKIFALKMEPPKEQPFLVVMDTVQAHESARIVFDP